MLDVYSMNSAQCSAWYFAESNLFYYGVGGKGLDIDPIAGWNLHGRLCANWSPHSETFDYLEDLDTSIHGPVIIRVPSLFHHRTDRNAEATVRYHDRWPKWSLWRSESWLFDL